MSTWVRVVSPLFLALTALAACGQEEEHSIRPISLDVPIVTFDADGFSPLRLEVEVGQQVLFTNESDTFFWPASNIHPTHQIYAEFDAKAPIESGGFWAFTFERPGFWRYHNHLGTERSGLGRVHTT